MGKRMTDQTGRALIDFLDRAGQKGWINKNTAAGYRAACQRVLEVEGDWQAIDISAVDVDELFSRFQNLKGADYSPGSLETYRSRLRNAVEMYLEWAANPSGWKAPSSLRRSRGEKPQVPSKNAGGEGVKERELVRHDLSSVDASMITYPFPLRGDLLAKLILPRDLTSEEARRLVAFVNALAIGEPAGEVH